jgi:hypothetical protein
MPKQTPISNKSAQMRQLIGNFPCDEEFPLPPQNA